MNTKVISNIGILLLGSCLPALASETSRDCIRSTMTGATPTSFPSAVWIAAADGTHPGLTGHARSGAGDGTDWFPELLLLDRGEKQLLASNRSGDLREVAKSPEESGAWWSSLSEPLFVRDGGPGRFWIQNKISDESTEIIEIKQGSEADSSKKLLAPRIPLRPKQLIRAVFRWTVVGDSGVLAFADVFDPKASPEPGQPVPQYKAIVYYQSIDEVDEAVVLREFKKTERLPVYSYTAFGEDFLAGAEDGGFYLDFVGDRLHVGRFDLASKSGRTLGPLPAEFSAVDVKISRAEEQRGRGAWLNYRTVRAFQASKTISALLWDWKRKELYALAKSQMYATRDSDWWLLRLDPQTAAEIDRVQLPIEGARVKAIPGDQWAFLGFGPAQFYSRNYTFVLPARDQVLVPGEWLRGGGPLLPFGRAVECSPPPAKNP